ncbi:MAG: hypothetical protein KGJ79_12505 [Alphaproteobacteria bacterium]|nr:hypothetical protein [Alphaproteobacteria bacterium]MDE2111957.1 hypothetical protein [Alphaproteobacteria bacterium]MDE2493008.1 hypothetical protein [Alphaproteobacteria bacterium]
MISYVESMRFLVGLAKPLTTETVMFDQADGRVLAAPVLADRNAPALCSSAMDGYAARDQDLRILPASLQIAGKSFAGGRTPQAIAPGTCMRVFTGAVVPMGTDRVVIQEDVVAEDGRAHFYVRPGCNRHIRAAGSDFAEGHVLVPAGVPLNPQRLVPVAAADRASIDVIPGFLSKSLRDTKRQQMMASVSWRRIQAIVQPA